MKRFRQYLGGHWRMIVLWLLVLAALVMLLLFRLGSLTGGLSASEVAQQQFSGSWHHIAYNPLNLPLTVLQWLVLTVTGHHGQTIMRLPSAIFGAVSLLAFAYVLRRWYGTRTALFGSILFGCSSWFLHVSRFGGTDSIYLWAIPTLLATLIIWERQVTRPIASYAAVAMLSLLLYVPGMIWVIIAAMALQPHYLLGAIRRLGRWWQLAILGCLFGVLVLPLMWSMISTPSVAQTWLGLPHHFGPAKEIVRRFGQSISFLIYRGPSDPRLWLDRLAVLDIFTAAMALLGLIFYTKHLLAPRTRLLFAIILISMILFALGGPVTYSILIPSIYIVVTAGVGYLLHEWLHVFPRNPLARSVGYGLLGLAILLACTYNVRSYFIAWPHSPATTTTFSHRE